MNLKGNLKGSSTTKYRHQCWNQLNYAFKHLSNQSERQERKRKLDKKEHSCLPLLSIISRIFVSSVHVHLCLSFPLPEGGGSTQEASVFPYNLINWLIFRVSWLHFLHLPAMPPLGRMKIINHCSNYRVFFIISARFRI